jgi:NADH-quinone oxidoreductase subunit G
MTRILVDGRDYEAKPDENLLQACLGFGIDLPYFCWHPALGSVGACRQCAVRQYADANDKTGRIVMACMTPLAEGARFSVADAEAVEFRASVIEWLMVNHPHDCPVCEEGGECHLQDMTVMTGHAHRRYRFTKRTHRNQNLGPFVKHEMNRCIACYRCVRFYQDYAGGHDLEAFAAHDHVYFGRHQDGVLESEFSGNLVEVCPTGVFTDKTLSAQYSRKWDMRGAPSVCAHCGLGCNTIANERAGSVRRILNRYNGAVNGYFLCDRGRFGYGFVNGPDRLRTPLLRAEDGRQLPASPDMALAVFTGLLEGARARGGRVVGIGSPRASLEANFALRALVGAADFHAGIADGEYRALRLAADILGSGAVRTPSLREAEAADGVLVLGEDVPNTAPRLALTLRQAVRQAGFALAARYKIPPWQDAAVRGTATGTLSPLFIATPGETRLDDVAREPWRAAPADIARLGFAVACCLDPAAPAVAGLDEGLRARAGVIAEALLHAENPLIVSGVQAGDAAIIQAAFNVARALRQRGKQPGLIITVPESNSMGLALMAGGALGDALARPADLLIVLENDLYRRARRDVVDAALAAGSMVVLDHTASATTRRAAIVLPGASFAEADGTLVSGEGRAQRFYQVAFPEDGVREAWRWLRDACPRSQRSLAWGTLDDVTGAIAAALPQFAGIGDAAPGEKFRVAGSRIRSEPHRFSGRTAIDAAKSVHEPKPPETADSPFSTTMEGYYGQMPAALIPFVWAPAWNSGQAVNKFQAEIGGTLRGGDPGIRLFEPKLDGALPYFDEIPAAFVASQEDFLAVPLHRVFGDEEQSAAAPAIRERGTGPIVALNPTDAARIAAEAGSLVDCILEQERHRLPVEIHAELPPGVAGIAGLAAFSGRALPARMHIAAAAAGGTP